MDDQQKEANEKDGAAYNSGYQKNKTKLIVNYIPQFATEKELAIIFAQVGQIESIRIMRDFRTGYSYGYGFVKYTKPEAAAKAIEVINGMNFKNKRLKVSYSRPPVKDIRDTNLYITNLPKNFTEDDIDEIFSEYGEIMQRTILKDKITGVSRGVAFVRFSKNKEAQTAIAALDGKHLEDTMVPLSIRVAEDYGRQKSYQFMNHPCMCNNRDWQSFINKPAAWEQVNQGCPCNFIGNIAQNTLATPFEFFAMSITDQLLSYPIQKQKKTDMYKQKRSLLGIHPYAAMTRRLQINEQNVVHDG